jgi:hypothetical protein
VEDDASGDQTSSADGLDRSELIPAEGGEWSGLLFDNPTVGLPPRLTWTFAFPYQDVARDYGDSPVSLTIDWIPLATPSWRGMTGLTARSVTFGERGEASIYFFAHHRYASIDLDLLAQRDLTVHAYATVYGDIDGLGIESLTADAWLRFAGITVALSDSRAADVAWARLQDFTDTTELSPTPAQRRNRFHFVAANT